jgi:phage/plasmid-like protein (TIGR03299 family)
MKGLAFDILAKEYMCFVTGKSVGMVNSVDKPVTWEAAMQLAHLTFTVSKRQMKHPNFPDRTIESWGIFRDDTEEFLGHVGRIYKTLQFQYAFNLLIGEAGGSHYESAGALGRGNQFWVLARVPAADFYVNGTGDQNLAHVLFTSSHDGTIATSARLSHVSVNGSTTLQTALKGTGGAILRIKHTTNAEKKLNAVRNLMEQVVLCSQDIAIKLNMLAEREITKDSMVSILDRVFPGDQGTRHNNVLNRIIDLFEAKSVVSDTPKNGYDLLGAIAKYVDHEKSVRITRNKKGMTEAMLRAESSVFGKGNDLKEFALGVILEETKIVS